MESTAIRIICVERCRGRYKWREASTGSNLEPAQQNLVLSYGTARAMWDKLILLHEQRTVTNKSGLQQQFYKYEMSDSDTAMQHVAKIVNLASRLKDVGVEVPDEMIVAKMLSSLTSKYETLQIAWDSVEPTSQTLDNLQERLVRFDSRHSNSGDTVSALAATKKDRGKKKTFEKKSKKDIECYKCHEMGHFARECKNSRKKEDGGEKSRENNFALASEIVATPAPIRYSESVEKQVREIMAADQREIWLADSGASRHLTFRQDWLTEYRQVSDGGTVSLGDGQEHDVVGTGTVLVKKLIRGKWCDGSIENVLYAPALKKNLFLVGICTGNGMQAHFDGEDVEIFFKNRVVASGRKQDNQVCRMPFKSVKPDRTDEVNAATTNLSVWHERLGHVGKRAICELVKQGLASGVKLTDKSDIFCEPCQLGKDHRKPFNRKSEKVKTVPGEMFHTDVCGPMSVTSPGGSRYFLTFKDDASDYRHAYFLKQKSEVFGKFKVFERLVANKFGRSMKILRSDNGREFCNRQMDEYLELHGIRRETTAPYTPEQNGKAERDNRTIVESARTMIHAKNLPLGLWAEAINCAIHVLNRTVWKSGQVTPYEMWVGKAPDLRHLRIFGSEAYMHVPKQFTQKFDARAKKLIFVGYKENSANYRLYDLETRKVSEARDVTFNEKIGRVTASTDSQPDDEGSVLEIFNIGEEPEKQENEVESGSDEEEDEEFKDAEPRPTAAVRVERTSADTPETLRTLRNRASLKKPVRYESDVAEYLVPSSYREAIKGTEATQWASAIEDEFRSHEENGTWSLVSRKPEMKIIDSKWVFRVKTDANEKNHRFKARLCARGFLQREGIDFNETFAPVIRKLDETVYMEVPEGLDVGHAGQDLVCKLDKSLYGLKQAPRCWKRFTRFLHEFEFKECEADKCVFVGRVKSEKIYLALFVDDGLIAANSIETLKLVIERLSATFNITVGDSSMFVGVQILRDRESKSLIIHQSSYTRKIIEKFGMANAKTLSVPADPHVMLAPYQDGEERSSNVPYREAVGSLVFLAAVSRPDITYAVNSVSKFVNNHKIEHWQAVKRIFAYLSGTVDYGIKYESGGSELELIGFSDADYAGDVETRRSRTGYVFCLTNGAFTWSSQRQKLITLSTTEAEYVAASTAARELIWLRKLLSDIGCPCVKESTLFVDNQSAIQLVENPVYHKRTKHIDIHYHYVRERVEDHKIVVKYVPSENHLMFLPRLCRKIVSENYVTI